MALINCRNADFKHNNFIFFFFTSILITGSWLYIISYTKQIFLDNQDVKTEILPFYQDRMQQNREKTSNFSFFPPDIDFFLFFKFAVHLGFTK